MKRQKIVFLIVVYKITQDLIEFIQSINLDTRLFEDYDPLMVVVDNGVNRDKSEYDKYKELFKGDFDYIYTLENLGYTNGNNYGIKHLYQNNISYDYLALLNDDMYLKENSSISGVLNDMNHHKLSAVQPVLIGEKGLVDSKGIHVLNNGKVVDIDFACKSTKSKEIYVKVPGLIGAAMFFQKQVVDKILEIDPNLFMNKFFAGSEDFDLSMRIRELGYDLYRLNNHEIIHKRGVTGSRPTGWMLMMTIRSKLYVILKYFSFTWLLYLSPKILIAILRLLYLSIKYRELFKSLDILLSGLKRRDTTYDFKSINAK